MARGPNDPVLWGSDGKPLSLEGALIAPAALNVAQIIMNYGKMHSFRWDEAMRNAPENALAMRRNTFYLSLLQERTAPTINLEWQVEVDDEDDPIQKLDAEICNRGWREVPDKPGLMTWLTQGAVWFGRAGQQGVWRETDSGLTNWVYHEPVHGDSIQFQWDNTPVILTSFYTANRVRSFDPDAVINATDRGAYGLRLYKPEYRQRFVIHKHCREASDYYEGEMSGGVHGIGLRSWVYWQGYIRDDALAAMTGFVSSTGMMDLMVFNFPQGDAAAQAQAAENAKRVSGKIALICPRDPAKDWPAIEQYPMNDAGVECMKGLIEDCYDRYTRELFVGQNMSSGGGGPGGLEGDGRAELAGDTKFQLCKTDALRLGESLTRDWLIPFRNFNRPGSKTPMRMRPVLQDPKQAEKAQNIAVAVQNGIEIEEDEAREVLGFKKPRQGKKTIGAKPAATPGAAPGAAPGQPPAPAEESGRAATPGQPKPPPDPSKAADFFSLLMDRLERITQYHAAQPPWPGAVFNEQHHRWMNPDGSDGPQGGRAATSQKPDLGGDDHPIALKPEIARGITAGIDADLDELPDDQRPNAGLVAKAKDLALTVAAKAYMWSMHATHSKAMGYLADVMEAVFDTPSDMAKLGYNPNTSSGTANPQVLDPIKDATGLSGHLVASVASKVLVKAAYWIKAKMKAKPDQTAGYDATEPDGYGEWADLIATVFERIHQGLGIDGKTPDARTIEQNLRSLVKGHEDRFAGYSDDFDESKHPRAKDGKFGSGSGGGKSGTGPKPKGASKPPTGRATPNKVKSNAARVAARPHPKAVKGLGKVLDVARSRRIKAGHKRESELAEAIGGFNLLDSEPADVAYMPEIVDGKKTGRGVKFDSKFLKQYLAKRAAMAERMKDESVDPEIRAGILRLLEVDQPLTFFEVKTLLTSKRDEVAINPDALKAKERWQDKYHARFHVVIIDDRKGKKHSGHRVYIQKQDQAVGKRHKLSESTKLPGLDAALKHATE